MFMDRRNLIVGCPFPPLARYFFLEQGYLFGQTPPSQLDRAMLLFKMKFMVTTKQAHGAHSAWAGKLLLKLTGVGWIEKTG